MKHYFSALLVFFVAPAIIFACSDKVSSQQSDTDEAINQAMQDKFSARFDSVFDVHGPVRSVTFTVTSNPSFWQLEYIVSKVEYLPRGNKWNIKGNQKYKLNNFTEDENRNFICDFIDEQDLNVSITYSFNPKTHRYDETTIQAAPEYDGCDLLYIYDEKDSIVSAEFTDFFWNSDKNDFDKKKSVLKVKDEGIDEYGNWTLRTLSNNNMSIIIKRSINYFSLEEIPVDFEVFEGDSLESNEIVGDFNGDGKLEKACVNHVDFDSEDNEYIKLKLSFSDSKIDTVDLGEGLGFALYNIGDINGDSCQDIGMVEDGLMSMWRGFYVWVSNKGHHWRLLTKFTLYLEQLDDGKGNLFIPIRRGDDGIIEYQEYEYNEEADMILKTKKLKVN